MAVVWQSFHKSVIKRKGKIEKKKHHIYRPKVESVQIDMSFENMPYKQKFKVYGSQFMAECCENEYINFAKINIFINFEEMF